MKTQRAYLAAILVCAWREATKLFFQKTWLVVVRDMALLLVTVSGMYAFQHDLAAQGLIPAGSNPALGKLIPAMFGVFALILLFLFYLFVEMVFISPYRVWSTLRPSATEPSAALVDRESKQLAGVVATLRDRVMIYGFKPPVMLEDPYYQHRSTLHHSTHAIWTQPSVARARMDFLHATACLADVNAKHEERSEVDYWRKAVTGSADTLIALLLGQSGPREHGRS